MRQKERIDVNAYKGVFDVQYSQQSESCKMDIYYPEAEADHYPLIVSIHGGAFKKCDKRDREMIEPMLKGLEYGYAVVGINYRLSGEAQFPDPVKDIKQALRFIYDSHDTYNFDIKKIIVWGGSAGGYYSLMSGLIYNESYFDEADLSSTIPIVSGVVSWFPPISFDLMDKDLKVLGLLKKDPDHSANDSPESLFLGEPVLKSKEKLYKSNPIHYINNRMPPMLIQHGSADQVVPYLQSERFVNEIKKLGVNEQHIQYQILDGAGHGDKAFELPDNLEIVYDFIKSCFSGF